VSQFEQWENIKFCKMLCKSASESFHMMKQAHSEEAWGRSAVFNGTNVCTDENQFGR
jgi:hypothetical protein